MAHEWMVQMHGFYLDMENRELRFDAVMSFDIAPKEGLKILCDEVQKAFPDYTIQIAPDVDVSVSDL